MVQLGVGSRIILSHPRVNNSSSICTWFTNTPDPPSPYGESSIQLFWASAIPFFTWNGLEPKTRSCWWVCHGNTAAVLSMNERSQGGKTVKGSDGSRVARLSVLDILRLRRLVRVHQCFDSYRRIRRKDRSEDRWYFSGSA